MEILRQLPKHFSFNKISKETSRKEFHAQQFREVRTLPWERSTSFLTMYPHFILFPKGRCMKILLKSTRNVLKKYNKDCPFSKNILGACNHVIIIDRTVVNIKFNSY